MIVRCHEQFSQDSPPFHEKESRVLIQQQYMENVIVTPWVRKRLCDRTGDFLLWHTTGHSHQKKGTHQNRNMKVKQICQLNKDMGHIYSLIITNHYTIIIGGQP